MNIFSLVIAIALAVIGLVLIGFFAKTLLEPCFGWLLAKRKAQGIDKLVERLTIVDELLVEKDFISAIKMLRTAMTYDVFKDESLIGELKRHYQNFLSRVVIVADEMESEAEFLAETEHLLYERIDLLALHSGIADSYTRVRSKREQQGKGLPEWTKEDFSTRLADITNELAENKKALQLAVDRLLSSLGKTEENEDTVTYH